MRAWVLVVALAGCLETQLQPCDDLLCPVGLQCVLSGGVSICATDEQIDACAGQPDTTTCTTQLGTGECIDAVCVVADCGNGRRELYEECDDGGLIAGDGCSSSCRLEICGNGITDQAAGEACDCGGPGVTPRPD